MPADPNDEDERKRDAQATNGVPEIIETPNPEFTTVGYDAEKHAAEDAAASNGTADESQSTNDPAAIEQETETAPLNDADQGELGVEHWKKEAARQKTLVDKYRDVHLKLRADHRRQARELDQLRLDADPTGQSDDAVQPLADESPAAISDEQTAKRRSFYSQQERDQQPALAQEINPPMVDKLAETRASDEQETVAETAAPSVAVSDNKATAEPPPSARVLRMQSEHDARQRHDVETAARLERAARYNPAQMRLWDEQRAEQMDMLELQEQHQREDDSAAMADAKGWRAGTFAAGLEVTQPADEIANTSWRVYNDIQSHQGQAEEAAAVIANDADGKAFALYEAIQDAGYEVASGIDWQPAEVTDAGLEQSDKAQEQLDAAQASQARELGSEETDARASRRNNGNDDQEAER